MDNSEIAREMYEAWNQGTVDRMIDFWTEDGDWHWEDPPELPDRRVLRGREDVEAHLRDLIEFIGGMRVEVEELLAIEDELVSVVRFTVTGAKSGIQLDTPIVQVFTFESGRVRRCRVFTDREQAIEAARESSG